MSILGLPAPLATAGAAREKYESHADGERQHGRERGPSADAELGMKESAFVVDGVENDLRGGAEKHTPKITKSMDMTTNEIIAARPATREPIRLAGMPVPQLDRKPTKATPPAIGCSTNKLVGEGLAIVDAVPKAAEGDGGISGRTDLVHVDFEDGEVIQDWGGDRGNDE
ncbi:MAG: hypothetical protein M1835_002867 [Candelina submexicana]|nr:MAG: hypothetical protein M1835_002867 [Candelina submexicana]